MNSESRKNLAFQGFIRVLATCLFIYIAGESYGFKVGLPTDKTAIHEGITAEAITATAPVDPHYHEATPVGSPPVLRINATFVHNVNAGVVNTDITHQFEPKYHFDDSTWANPGFDDGFGNLHDLLQRAKREAMICDTQPCTINPLFLQPIHDSFRGLVMDLEATYWDLAFNPGCSLQPKCPSGEFVEYATDTTEGALVALPDDNPDPDNDLFTGMFQMLTGELEDSLSGRLEDMAPKDLDFQNDVRYLRIIYNELQAYYAWQHLGHAFHGVQDFFAHSNYVELAAGLPGPPCPPSLQNSSCGTSSILAATGLAPNALRIPTGIPGVHWTLDTFKHQFNTGVLQEILPQYAQLQTGFINWVADWCASEYMITDPIADVREPLPNGANPDPPHSSSGYRFCHYLTPTTPGLNKDEPFEKSGDEPAHQNFDYARWAALQVSKALWMSFLNDLSAPPTSSLGTIVQRWGDFKKDNCTKPGYRQYSAVLEGIPFGQSWEKACVSKDATIAGHYFPKPDRCKNQGPGIRMWGEFDVPDSGCQAHWGGFQKGACVASGKRKYSAQIMGVPPGQSWESACASTPANVQGQSFATPSRCRNTGVTGEWGEFDASDSSCQAHWGGFQKGACVASGKRKYSAQIMGAPPGQSWESACASTPATVQGQSFPTPSRCVNTGVTGEWGEFDVPDSSCQAQAHWGGFQKGACVASGKRKYSAQIMGVPPGQSWESACASTPATVQGQSFPTPSRCVNTGLGGEWGEFDVTDNTCPE